MRSRGLAFVVAFAVALVAAPSSAAPQRSITLTPAMRTASWTSEFRVGPYFGESFGCDRAALGCESSLIRLSRPGSLSITTKQRVATNAVDGRLLLGLIRSDAMANKGRAVNVMRQRAEGTESIAAPSLASGYYLLVVTWYDLTVGDYAGKATYVPTRAAT